MLKGTSHARAHVPSGGVYTQTFHTPELGAVGWEGRGGKAFTVQPATMLLILLRGLCKGWLQVRLPLHAVRQTAAPSVVRLFPSAPKEHLDWS